MEGLTTSCRLKDGSWSGLDSVPPCVSLESLSSAPITPATGPSLCLVAIGSSLWLTGCVRPAMTVCGKPVLREPVWPAACHSRHAGGCVDAWKRCSQKTASLQSLCMRGVAGPTVTVCSPPHIPRTTPCSRFLTCEPATSSSQHGVNRMTRFSRGQNPPYK